mgnify:CR=1 FL=1
MNKNAFRVSQSLDRFPNLSYFETLEHEHIQLILDMYLNHATLQTFDIMKTNSITFYALSKGKLKNSHARIVQLYVYVGVRTWVRVQ